MNQTGQEAGQLHHLNLKKTVRFYKGNHILLPLICKLMQRYHNLMVHEADLRLRKLLAGGNKRTCQSSPSPSFLSQGEYLLSCDASSPSA